MPTTPAQIYISHAPEDEARCAPLLDLLDAWNVEYWFDRQQGGGRQLSTRAQRALNDCSVLLRICTPATNNSYSMSLEVGAILSLQADDHRAGRVGRRTLVNLILDPGYRREPFDSTAPVLDATDPAGFGWVNTLRRGLSLPAISDAEAAAVARRMIVRERGISRRRALTLGAAGVVIAAAAASGGVILLKNRGGASTGGGPTPTATPPSSDPKLKWYTRVVDPATQASADLGVGVAPTLAGGMLFTGALDGSLYAVDASTGAVRWHKTLGEGFYTAPVVGNGVVYACSHDESSDGGVYAFDVAAGQQQWLSKTPVLTYTSLAFVNGQVYVGGYKLGGFLAVLDPVTGNEQYEVYPGSTERLPSSQFAFASQVAYVGSTDGYLVALDLTKRTTSGFATPAEIWQTDVGASAALRLKVPPFFASGLPAVANGLVYAGSEDQSVYALDAATGRQRWSFATTSQIVRSSPAVVGGALYIGSDDTKLYALDAASGASRWVYQTGGKVRSSPVVANGTVYVGSADANVYVVDTQTGTLVRTYKTAGAIIAPPLVANGILYAADLAGYLYAFSLS